MSLHESNPGTSFKEYFEIVPALTDELRNEAYRIRHQVYCEELKFEQIQPEGRESDEYDFYSLHILIRSTRTNEFIGCTRIIRPRHGNSYFPLPFEKACSAVLNRAIIDPQKLSRPTIAEVSRLAVIESFRRRKDDKNSVTGLSDKDFGANMQSQLQPRFPYIPLGLYLGTTELARLNGIDTLFVLTEERLAKHLNKLGFGLRFIGEPINHRGIRIPSMMTVSGIINGMKPTLRPLYNAIAADIKKLIKNKAKVANESLPSGYQDSKGGLLVKYY